MPNKEIFTVSDPLKNVVYLDEERYEHIHNRHPELLVNDILGSVQCPEYIITDSSREFHNDYFAHSSFNYPQFYVKTSVDTRASGKEGKMKVITSHLVDDVKLHSSSSEDILYDRSKNNDRL